MTQPELGLKIAEWRKLKGLTQQELAERCNINIRTIQRIEAGKVDPRTYTTKQLLECLGLSYEEMLGAPENAGSGQQTFHRIKDFFFFTSAVDEQSRRIALLWAWTMGIVYFIVEFPEVMLGAKAMEMSLSPGEEIVFLISKGIAALTYIFFIRGFIVLGKILEMQALRIVSSLMLVLFPVFSVAEIGGILTGFDIIGIVVLESVCMGVLHMIFGYVLFKSEREFGRLGVIAGALEIVAGFTFIAVIIGFLGLFLLIPIEILEIILLLKFYLNATERDKIFQQAFK